MKRFKMLVGWGKKYTLEMILMCSMTVISQVIFSFLPVFIQFAIKFLSNGDVYDVNLPRFLIAFLCSFDKKIFVVIAISVTMILLQIIRSLFLYIEAYFKGYITQHVTKDMRLGLYYQIGNLSYTYHNNANAGDLLQRCTSDVETSSAFLSERTPELLFLITCAIIGAIQIGKINITIMLICLICLPITITSSTIFYFYSSKKFKQVEQKESEMVTTIQENLSGIRVVKAFANEKYEINKFEEKSKDYVKKLEEHGGITASFWGLLNIILYSQYAFIVLFSIVLAQKQLVDSADLFACFLLVGMLIWPMQNLGRVIGELGKTLVAVERIDEVLKEPSEFEDNGEKKPSIEGNIEFKNVCFSFSNDQEVLHDISFKINKGETVAVVGKTGSGKTTIANIIGRLLDYSSGNVLIDGIELKEIEKKHLRKNVGMVMQDPFLYSKTICENISIANKEANIEDIYKAAKMATIDKDILEFEQGYDTLVGERGATMSGGQRQRMAIARVLVDKKPIVIFDDSLSAVDNKTDNLIREAIKENDATTIIITHRTTTAKQADKIIVLNKGTIESIGTHEELIKKDGLYSELWKIQGFVEEEFMKLVKAGEFDE